MITTLRAFLTSKRHRLPEFFSPLEGTGKHPACSGHTCQGAASIRLCPGQWGALMCHAHNSTEAEEEGAQHTTRTSASKIPVYGGLCRVSPRNTFWKCYVFQMCVISGSKILFYQHDSTGYKQYMYKMACQLPWKEMNLSYTEHVTWK